jgi:hypothetical protein
VLLFFQEYVYSNSQKPFSVEVGIYILDYASLDLKNETYWADFYLWFKWDKRRTFAPEHVEFMNGVDVERVNESNDMFPDKKYWGARFRGTFHAQFNLKKYPFDSQVLPIIFEHTDLNSSEMIFVPEKTRGKRKEFYLNNNVNLSNWEIKEIQISVKNNKYATDFGYPTSKDSFYSRYYFSVRVKRIIFPYLMKFVLPLLIIVLMSFLVFFINAKEFEAQTGITVTSLLSAVALHITNADQLPQVGYLVGSDKFFILAYILIFFTLVETVMCNNMAKKGNTEGARKLDQWSIFIFPLVLILGVIWILWENNVI